MFVELLTFNIYRMFLCRVALLTYKHKTHVINNDGSVLSNADVDFYVDDVSTLSFTHKLLKGLFAVLNLISTISPHT
jgi:hypothetical protein